MKKWVCTVCGYVYEGENPPEKCPQCGVPASKFKEQAADETSWACEHEVGVAQGSPEDIMADLRANFEGECSEVGMYLAMARVAHREGVSGSPRSERPTFCAQWSQNAESAASTAAGSGRSF